MRTLDPIYVAHKIIDAQQAYMQAYRKGETPPEWAQLDLKEYMLIWETLKKEGKV